MTYLAAYCLLSLIGCAVCFFITHDTDNDDAEQQLHGAGASESTERIRAIYGLDCFRNAAEENDAAIGRLVQTIDWSE